MLGEHTCALLVLSPQTQRRCASIRLTSPCTSMYQCPLSVSPELNLLCSCSARLNTFRLDHAHTRGAVNTWYCKTPIGFSSMFSMLPMVPASQC